jgi:hypothetical protein
MEECIGRKCEFWCTVEEEIAPGEYEDQEYCRLNETSIYDHRCPGRG